MIGSADFRTLGIAWGYSRSGYIGIGIRDNSLGVSLKSLGHSFYWF